MVKNMTFHLSTSVYEQMSVQSFHCRDTRKGTLWINGGTNVSTMGRTFCMLEYNGRLAGMIGFLNDSVKRNVPIG